MSDTGKTKKQLVDELSAMRRRIEELEAASDTDRPTETQTGDYAGKIDALQTIAQIVNNTMNLDEMLRSSMDQVIKVMSAGVYCIYMLEAAQKLLSLQAHKGIDQEIIDTISSLTLGEEELQNLQRWKAPSTHLSEILDASTMRKISSAFGTENLKAVVTMPLSARRQLLGVIVMGNLADPKLVSDELELLTAMGDQMSMGIENAVLQGKARELSLTDELTGLYSRRYFYIVLHNEMHRAQRYGPSSSMVMLDIDGFRDYNDKFGHTAGDGALKALAQTLIAELRQTDMSFRFGGDEFVIILPATTAEIAREIVDRIKIHWAQVSRAQYGTQESALGLSAGIVQFPRDADTADGLVLLAETTLREARGEGGGKSMLASEMELVHSSFQDTASVDQIYALAATVDARDPYASGHWERVTATADLIGRAIGLSADDLNTLHAAALLHDIGKVSIPDQIITKADKPTDSEWEIIKKHSVEGARIVGNIGELSKLAPIIRHHHESYDGTGYPDGLKGEDIPIGARIVHLADAYDTMTTFRPYRNTISYKEACSELKQCAGSQFDPEIVEAFITAMGKSLGAE
jgi:diguanylate cyclase (GGDEF)-like protein/putative nucleotidyltransferase with HDIG domain